MFCPNCGARFDSGNFCRGCGSPLRAEQSRPSGSYSASPPARRGSGTILSLFNPVVADNASRDLDGHTAVSIMGRLRIDLTARPLQPGESRLSVCSVFGHTRLVIPADAGIRITGLSVLSHVELDGQDVGNSFVNLNEYTTPGYSHAVRRIHIDIASMCGRVTITSVNPRR
jgi:hypothetical protein